MKGGDANINNIKTAIVLPDTQLPYEDKIALKAVEKFIADNWFDYWIQVGDLMDFNYASKWTADNLKVLSGTTFQDDYEYARKFLDRHIKLVRGKNPDAEMVVIEGNHDWRPEKIIEKDPRFEGLIEFSLQLRLRAKNIKFVRYWSKGEVYRIGKATFIHGRYTNDHHAKKHVQNFGCNIFYGHTHDIQNYSLERYNKQNAIVGQSLGCLCKYGQDYMVGRPHRWQQAIGYFQFFPNGDFTYSIIRITNGRFIFNGKAYSGWPGEV